MPATLNHIRTNLERIESSEFDDLKQILAAARQAAEARDESDTTDPLQVIWKTVVSEAEARNIGEKIPGTVGREFAKAKGLIHARPARGERTEVRLTSAAEKAVNEYRKPSDQVRVEANALVFTSQAGAVRAVEAMIKRASNDNGDAKAAAGARNALKALLTKITGPVAVSAPAEQAEPVATEV